MSNIITDAICTKCGSTDVDYDDMQEDFCDDTFTRDWTCICLKCKHAFYYKESYTLTGAESYDE